MSEDFEREDLLRIVDHLIDDWLAAAGITEPPINAIALAQGHLGLQICLDRRPPPRLRLPRGTNPRAIYLDPDLGPEQQQAQVAHALGTLFKPELLDRLGIPPEQRRGLTGESMANLLAAHLLVPTCWFAEEARQLDYDVIALQRRFATASVEMVAWRMLDLAEPSIITLIDNEHVARRRSNAWQVTRTLEPVEVECQRYVHQYSRPRCLRENGWTVHGWPVHQPDWKREILRSVVETID